MSHIRTKLVEIFSSFSRPSDQLDDAKTTLADLDFGSLDVLVERAEAVLAQAPLRRTRKATQNLATELTRQAPTPRSWP